jgi:DNA-directed RNA polymerase specialized sigma24 family protein
MGSSELFALALSMVRDFAIAEKVMRARAPREAVLGMSRRGRREIALGREAVEAVLRADLREPSEGWREAVEGCLAQVDRRTRSLLGMRYRDGLSVKAIARRTKATPDAVLSSLSRARARLARLVELRRTTGGA